MLKSNIKRVSIICLIIPYLFTVLFLGCKEEKKEAEEEITPEMFPVYIGKDTFIEEINAYKLIPYKDRKIPIDRNKTINKKLSSLTDTLSKSHFNDLKIDVSKIYSNDSIGKIANINLIEDPGFDGPGSLPSYQSWYDYFQGSHGGQHTTILLRENILQKDYQGPWIDGVVFFYQGDSIGIQNHVNLHGVITE